ncbi:hypothetical protein [Flavobacterium anhuiense]
MQGKYFISPHLVTNYSLVSNKPIEVEIKIENRASETKLKLNQIIA